MKSANTNFKFFFAVFALLFIQACKNTSDDIPFPSDESEYKVVTGPLQFSEPVKVAWDSSKFSHLKPAVKKFDYDKLTSALYDSAVYFSFLKPPAEVALNWYSLPEKNFDPDSLPFELLTFKTYLIEPAKIIKAGAPHVIKPGLLEFGKEQGAAGTNFSALLKDRNGALWIKKKSLKIEITYSLFATGYSKHKTHFNWKSI